MKRDTYRERWLAPRRELVALLQQKCQDTANLRRQSRETSTEPRRRPESSKDGDRDAEALNADSMDGQARALDAICRQIKAAIAHGDEGSYGLCANADCETGGDIGTQRLEKISYATRCRECQELEESKRMADAPPLRAGRPPAVRRDPSSGVRFR